MRYSYGAILALGMGIATAAPPTSSTEAIRVPTGPKIPSPMPRTDAQIKLESDELFVIDADNPILVLASPKHLVRITEEPGPLKIRGKFTDSLGSTETRTFKGKTVVLIEAALTGECEIIVIPVGASKSDQAIRRTLLVEAGEGPQPPPPPKPKPDPKVDPVTPVAPISEEGLRVLIVYDGDEKAVAALSEGHQEIIFGAPFRSYLEGVCVKGPDGKTPERRIWKNTTANPESDSQIWAKAFARKRDSLPWLLVSNGKTGFEGPLPKDSEAAKELIGRYK